MKRLQRKYKIRKVYFIKLVDNKKKNVIVNESLQAKLDELKQINTKIESLNFQKDKNLSKITFIEELQSKFSKVDK